MGKEVFRYNVSTEVLIMNALQWKALKVKRALSAFSHALRNEDANRCGPNHSKYTRVLFQELIVHLRP